MINRILLTMSRVRPGLLFALLLLIGCVYFSTYSARIDAVDTLRIFDATSSLIRFGDTERDEALWQEPPGEFLPDDAYPLVPFEPEEDWIVYFVAPFYGVATLFPGIGLVHAVWLFNIAVGVALAGIWYLLARELGYDRKTSLFGTCLLALATIIWVYSKTLFREPLVALFLLLVTLLILRWRNSHYRQLGWLIAALLLSFILYQTRNSSVLALPALLLFTVPLPVSGRLSRIADMLLLTGLAFAGVLILLPDSLPGLISMLPVRFAGFNTDYAQIALQSYLLSPGASIWGTSPVLLLAIPGSIMLVRRQQRRLIWFVLLLLASYALGHALLTDRHWFGGVSYPPRFLVPVVPFAMLLTLPALQFLLQRAVLWQRLVTGLLILYSIGIQLVSVLSFPDAYTPLLPEASGGLLEWAPGYMEPRYFRWVLLPQTWQSIGFDNAWTSSGAAWMIALWLIIGLSALVIATRRNFRYAPLLLSGLTLTAGIVVWGGLRWLHDHDGRYQAGHPQLFGVLDYLRAESDGIEPLLLADITYSRFIMNYNRVPTIRPLILGFQPGEAVSDRMPPRIESDYVPELLDRYAVRLIDHLGVYHERIWLLAHNSEYLHWSIRPVERYLAANYYPLSEYVTDDPTVRLLEFATANAPNRADFRLPEVLTDLRFGTSIQLEGVTLPHGLSYHAGDVVPVTFFWKSSTLIDDDYVVAWFIVATDNSRITQGIDSMPGWGFAPTSGWVPQQIVYDNRAIELPDDLAAGEYVIWVVLYPRSSGGSIRLPVTGEQVLDGTIGILPVMLQVIHNE